MASSMASRDATKDAHQLFVRLILQFKERLRILAQFLRPVGIQMFTLQAVVRQAHQFGYSVLYPLFRTGMTKILCPSLENTYAVYYVPYIVSPMRMVEITDGSKRPSETEATRRTTMDVGDPIEDRLANWYDIVVKAYKTPAASMKINRILSSIGELLAEELGEWPFEEEGDVPEGEVCGDLPCEDFDEVRLRRSKGPRKRGKG